MNATTTKAKKPALDPNAIYMGDNGRIFCGELRCAGSTAYASGRDLSGKKVIKATARDIADYTSSGFECKCERCGKVAK